MSVLSVVLVLGMHSLKVVVGGDRTEYQGPQPIGIEIPHLLGRCRFQVPRINIQSKIQTSGASGNSVERNDDSLPRLPMRLVH